MTTAPKFDISLIEKNISCMKDDPLHRYWSWDDCFEAFSVDSPSEYHCLHLGFYLASWGMYRGSGGLLQKNKRIHQKAVNILFQSKYLKLKCCSNYDVDPSLIPLILEIKAELSTAYRVPFIRGGQEKTLTDIDTLLSKVMLGTLCTVPAYDRYFIDGLKIAGIHSSRFTETSLHELFNWMAIHRADVVKAQMLIKDQLRRHYPLMKILDMHFWQLGFDAAR